MSGHSDHRGIVGHVAKHDRSGAYPAIVPYRDVAQNLRAATNHHVVEKRRMPLAALLAGPAERHTLVKRDIVTDHGSLTNHHAHAVIDEQTTADLRPGMDLDAGEQARHLRQPARQEKAVVIP